MALLNQSNLIGFQQLLQILNFLPDFPAVIGISDFDSRFPRFKYHGCRQDILVVTNRVLHPSKWFVGSDPDPVGIINQRIPGNPRLRLIHLAEPTVNDDQFAACFYRFFAVFAADRYVAVDNMGKLAVEAESCRIFRQTSFLELYK